MQVNGTKTMHRSIDLKDLEAHNFPMHQIQLPPTRSFPRAWSFIKNEGSNPRQGSRAQ